MTKTPKHLDRKRVRQILRRVKPVSGIGSRIAAISEEFLEYPYMKNMLIGDLDQEEVFTASFSGFDCVTYVETVLALARASSTEEFVGNLQYIRYADGEVDWKKRNHYMTTWIRNNSRAGVVRNRTRGPGLVERRRCLNVLHGLPERTIRVRSIPKREFMRRREDVRTGDLIFFASTLPDRDVFHCGILIHEDGVRMRHAPLSRGHVVDQDLAEFLNANRMSGVILARPQEVDRSHR